MLAHAGALIVSGSPSLRTRPHDTGSLRSLFLICIPLVLLGEAWRVYELGAQSRLWSTFAGSGSNITRLAVALGSLL